MNERRLRFRLSLMMFLQFAAMGAYQISIGIYLASIGYGSRIAWFYAAQGIAAIFMPALVGRIADRYVPAQKLFGMCHILSAVFFVIMAFAGGAVRPSFMAIFIPYVVGVLIFVPTISLSNSICFILLAGNGADVGKSFPMIRIWGTIGFIVSMLAVNFMNIESSADQFLLRAAIGLLLGVYAFLLQCDIHSPKETAAYESSWTDSFRSMHGKGLTSFFILTMLFGVCLHMSNGFTGPYLDCFETMPQYEGSAIVGNSMMVMSVSQVCEALCTLIMPFMLRRMEVKHILMISALAWCARYLLLSFGNPADGAWMIGLAMVMYGIAFDMFNISVSIHIDSSVHPCQRAFAQGLLVVMTNGLGASIGMLGVQKIVNIYTWPQQYGQRFYTFGDWQTVWLIFAVFAFVLFLLVLLLMKNKKTSNNVDILLP